MREADIAWLTATYTPGFQADPTAWSVRISTSHKAEVFVDGVRVAKVRLTPDRVDALREAVAHARWDTLSSSRGTVDDMDVRSVEVDGHEVVVLGWLEPRRVDTAAFFGVWDLVERLALAHVDSASSVRDP